MFTTHYFGHYFCVLSHSDRAIIINDASVAVYFPTSNNEWKKYANASQEAFNLQIVTDVWLSDEMPTIVIAFE
jgi:hypothetical protein